MCPAFAATGFENTAALDRSRAEAAGAQIGPRMTTGYLSAAGTLLKGGVGVYDALPGKDIFEKLKFG